MTHTMRWVSTRVLPLPAPASTSTGPSGAVTASRCASFSGLSNGESSRGSGMGGAFYRRARLFAPALDNPFLGELQKSGDKAKQHRADHQAENSKGRCTTDCAY